MSNLLYKTAEANLLKKASAVKFGWLGMDSDRRWFWYSKKPEWIKNSNWWATSGSLENVKFLKLPKRSQKFAPLSLIKCTPDGPILLSTGNQYHKIYGMIGDTLVSILRERKKANGRNG